MNATRKFTGQFLWLRCSVCRREFPIFIFSGDTDMATEGLRSSVNLEDKKIYIYDESRRGEFCRTSNCKEPEFLSVEREKCRLGESFQQFLKRSRGQDVYKYRCLACSESGAIAQQKLTKEEVCSKNYEIVLDDRLGWA
jgi:hypothetical protein